MNEKLTRLMNEIEEKRKQTNYLARLLASYEAKTDEYERLTMSGQYDKAGDLLAEMQELAASMARVIICL